LIFVDTGAFIGRYRRRDQHHRDAVEFWKEIEAGWERCLTSSYVLAEMLTFLGRRAGNRFAAEKARLILASRRITVVRPDEDDEQRALALFEKFDDQERVSFTDCLSFALMRARRITRAFTFDHHFGIAGFVVLPAWSVNEPETAAEAVAPSQR
jgi:uncharacterized protein